MNAIRFYRENNTEYYEIFLEEQDLKITSVLLDFIEETLRAGRKIHIIADRTTKKTDRVAISYGG